MALCSSCNKEKDSWDFLGARGKVTKQCSDCRERGREKAKRHYDKNAKKEIKRIKRWRAQNPDVHRRSKRIRDARYAKNNPAARAKKNKRYRQKNPGKHTARVTAYHAKKVQATPRWADKKAIEKIYEAAAFMRTLTGKKVQVDHIVPLKSKLVCGLHVHQNLRIVVGSFNARKSNKTWPDMP